MMPQSEHLNNDAPSSSFQSAQGKVNCSIYKSFEEISDLQPQWDAFVETVSGDIFLTFDWCRTWWRYYGKNRELQVFLFTDSNLKIIGIIPLFIDTIWVGLLPVRAGKIVGSDFTLAQFTLPLQEEYLNACIELFLEKVMSIHWHILSVGPIAGLSTNTGMIKESLVKSSGGQVKVVMQEGMVQTYYKLESSWEKYLARLNSDHRSKMLLQYKRLKKQVGTEPTIEIITADNENIKEMFEKFVEMHQEQWKSIGKRGHFGDWPDAFEYHHDLAAVQGERRRLRLLEMKINDDVVFYEYAYRFGNKFFAFLNARTSQKKYLGVGIGTIGFSESAKIAIAEKVDYIDSMRGKYEYKCRLGGQLFKTHKMFLIHRTLWNAIRIKLFFLFSNILDIVYYKIWFQRIAPKLFREPKSLLKLWIRSRL